jgi:hypothetical protein
LIGALLMMAAAWADPGGVGETMDWSVQYMGMSVGSARVEVHAGEGGQWVIKGHSWSAPWYSRIYNVDDHTASYYSPGQGSTRYVTVFREGRFQQDQDMRIAPEGITVSRRQNFDEGWRDWEDSYEGPGRMVEDPVTAFYHLRRLALVDGTVEEIPLFSGKRVTAVQVHVEGRERVESAVGSVDTVRVRISSKRDDELKGKGRIWVWLTDDEERLPVQVIWKSGAIGTVRAELTGWTQAPANEQRADAGPGEGGGG